MIFFLNSEFIKYKTTFNFYFKKNFQTFSVLTINKKNNRKLNLKSGKCVTNGTLTFLKGCR